MCPSLKDFTQIIRKKRFYEVLFWHLFILCAHDMVDILKTYVLTQNKKGIFVFVWNLKGNEKKIEFKYY